MNNKDNNLIEEVFNRIDRDNIRQIPKWRFIIKNYLFWMFALLSIIIAAFSVSVIILSFFKMEIPIADRVSGGIMKHIILFAPYIWFLFLSLFVIFGLGNFIHTKYGYKRGKISIVIISIVLSTFLGLFLYYTGVAHKIENYTNTHRYMHNIGTEVRRKQMWIHPDKGLLAGVPLSIADSDIDKFDLVDFTGKVWVIDSSRLNKEELAIVSVSGDIAIIGIKKDNNTFEACAVVPWERFKNKSSLFNDIKQFIGDEEEVSERNIFELRTNICK